MTGRRKSPASVLSLQTTRGSGFPPLAWPAKSTCLPRPSISSGPPGCLSDGFLAQPSLVPPPYPMQQRAWVAPSRLTQQAGVGEAPGLAVGGVRGVAVGIARVFASCWRHTGERPVRWTHHRRLGGGEKGLQGCHWVSPGAQGEPGQDKVSSEDPPLGAPSLHHFGQSPLLPGTRGTALTSSVLLATPGGR